MNERQLEALFSYIDAKVKLEIERAFGRDLLYEAITEAEAKTELAKAFNLPE